VSAFAAAIGAFAEEIAMSSAALGRRVAVEVDQVADRRGSLVLKRPGLWSPNRSCRMVRAADGWIAVNLPRESDRELVPAWIGCEADAEPWNAILAAARARSWRSLVADARVLGLPACGVGEVRAERPDAPLHRLGEGGEAGRPGARMRVVDLSSMWAGPLCGGLLASAGAAVTKIESRTRPDALREASPAFFERLNGCKVLRTLDFVHPDDLGRLVEVIAAADVVITSARPRAFEQLGLTPRLLFKRNPRLTWVAISGYGWMGDGADRVAFGDDAAAAGGLVRRTVRGEPRFMGDALADPLTGLAAAVGAFKSIRRGGGFLVDAALAATAAGVAARRPNAPAR
jgi:hypothetical protein